MEWHERQCYWQSTGDFLFRKLYGQYLRLYLSYFIFTSDKGGGKGVCPRLSCLCLSVSKIPQKRVHGFGMKRSVSTDIGTWTNWLTFEPDPDYSPDAGTGLLSPLSYKWNFTSGKSDVYVLVAAARRGFTMEWLHSMRQWAVETPLSEVHAPHRVPFKFVNKTAQETISRCSVRASCSNRIQ